MAAPRKKTAAAPNLHNLLNRAQRELASEMRRVVGAEGLPLEFWRVLEVLADEKGRTMSALAEEAGMQLPATCKLVDRMAEAALLQRSADPLDMRRVIVHISDFGLQKVALLASGMRRQRDRIDQAFGADRQAQLADLLRDFIQAYR